MKTVKLFVGLHLSENLKELLVGYQTNLKNSLAEYISNAGGGRPERSERIVRFVSREKMHMTLLFLGDIPEELLPVVYAAFDRAISGEISTEEGVPHMIPMQIGAFPNPRRARVIWVGAEDFGGTTELLVKKLREELAAEGNRYGFPVDTRPFVPHITIAYPRRNLTVEGRKALAYALDFRQSDPHADNRSVQSKARAHRIPRIAVIESRPAPGGTAYIDRHWIDL